MSGGSSGDSPVLCKDTRSLFVLSCAPSEQAYLDTHSSHIRAHTQMYKAKVHLQPGWRRPVTVTITGAAGGGEMEPV